jgi:hypothetical protein
MREMIEKVARALASSAGARMVGPSQSVATRQFGWKGDGEHLDQYIEAHWKEHEHAAIFAIEAMREPIDAMVDAAMAPYRHEIDEKMRAAFDQTIRGYWRSMIDEMLK